MVMVIAVPKGMWLKTHWPQSRKALALGVDGVEIDVFRCATGELVVFHDKTLDKLTDATGYIEDLALDSISKISVWVVNPFQR